MYPNPAVDLLPLFKAFSINLLVLFLKTELNSNKINSLFTIF